MKFDPRVNHKVFKGMQVEENPKPTTSKRITVKISSQTRENRCDISAHNQYLYIYKTFPSLLLNMDIISKKERESPL